MGHRRSAWSMVGAEALMTPSEKALAHSRSVWAHGEMYPKHMTEAYLAGHAEGLKEASELMDAAERAEIWLRDANYKQRCTGYNSQPSTKRGLSCVRPSLTSSKGAGCE